MIHLFVWLKKLVLNTGQSIASPHLIEAKMIWE